MARPPGRMFDEIPGVTAAIITILTADGAGHRYVIERPEGAAVRIDQQADLTLPDLSLGPAPPEIPRAYPLEVAFAFSVPRHADSRTAYTCSPAPVPQEMQAATTTRTGAGLAVAVMERMAIMNRVQALCQEYQHGDDDGPLACAVLDILADPDPLGHP